MFASSDPVIVYLVFLWRQSPKEVDLWDKEVDIVKCPF